MFLDQVANEEGGTLRDLILRLPNPWEKVYDPARVSLLAAPRFMKEALNTAVQYVNWMTPVEVKPIADIPPGSGAILRRGLSKVAVYRDEHGAVRPVSAVCPHLGCIVHWNPGQLTWDCPCHGSRFDRLGHVIRGPAVRDLTPANEDATPTETGNIEVLGG